MIALQEIFDLSVDERMEVIEKIWDSIDKSQIEMPASHEEELERRLARYESGETRFFTWEEVKKDLRHVK